MWCHAPQESIQVKWFSGCPVGCQYPFKPRWDAAHFAATTEDLVEWEHVSINYTFDYSNVPILSEFTSSGCSTTSWHLSADTSHTKKGKFPKVWLRGTAAGDEVGECWRALVLPPKVEISKISLRPSICIIVTYVITCSPGSNGFIGTWVG